MTSTSLHGLPRQHHKEFLGLLNSAMIVS